MIKKINAGVVVLFIDLTNNLFLFYTGVVAISIMLVTIDRNRIDQNTDNKHHI
jgi:hypothetical protein